MYPTKVLSKEAEGSWDGQRVNCNGVGVPTSVRWGWKCCDHYPRARCAFPEKNVSKELPARSERPHHKRHHHFKELVVGKGSHLKGVAPRSHKHTPRVDKSAIQQRPCEESCLQLNPWNMTPSALCKPLPPLCAWPREARTPGGEEAGPANPAATVRLSQPEKSRSWGAVELSADEKKLHGEWSSLGNAFYWTFSYLKKELFIACKNMKHDCFIPRVEEEATEQA